MVQIELSRADYVWEKLRSAPVNNKLSIYQGKDNIIRIIRK